MLRYSGAIYSLVGTMLVSGCSISMTARGSGCHSTIHSKRATNDKGRPIRISVWYPAMPAEGAEAKRYGDYFHYQTENNFQDLNEKLEKMNRESWLADVNEIHSYGSN